MLEKTFTNGQQTLHVVVDPQASPKITMVLKDRNGKILDEYKGYYNESLTARVPSELHAYFNGIQSGFDSQFLIWWNTIWNDIMPRTLVKPKKNY